MNEIMKKLNCGCGKHRAEGWLNIDLTTEGDREADVAADIRKLPFEDGEFERVYAGHVLEHVPFREVGQALSELKRVLAPGGTLLIVGPDIDLAKELCPEVVPSIETTHENRFGDGHKWFPTGPWTLGMCSLQFPEAYLLPINEIDSEWPLTGRADWQFAIMCKR